MKKCPSCGHETDQQEMRCPECGSFYSKIIELIEQEVAEEERQSVKGRCRRILNSDNKLHSIKFEFEQFKAGLTLQAKITLWVIFAFVFALMVIVL
ncbi:MAG: hypothetical protein PHH59_08070 [Methylovulum sp.]|uniref:hypothetical protein n=1 Tax=Methylovulum sp. TaxID=1916980 RepID=UPI002613657F|nr:hypothetical protein [Methylovulum sp.]MDD2723961.1 hypothetical protein [Methylovulum sp.]MDD5126378.1 hypothetical protein [Methylovulum sp.]